MSEAGTRRDLVDPKLKAAGWRESDHWGRRFWYHTDLWRWRRL